MTVRRKYDADADESIGLTNMTDNTLLKYGDIFWHKLLWFLQHQSMINAILEMNGTFQLGFWFLFIWS